MSLPWSIRASALSNGLLKGLLLALWMIALLYLAFLAWSNQASGYLLSRLSPEEDDAYEDANAAGPATPIDHLRAFVAHHDSPPPIDSLLRQIINNPDWTERDLDNHPRNTNAQWESEQYKRLFTYLENRLRSLVKNEQTDLSAPSYFSIPDVFLLEGDPRSFEVRLDPDTVRWVQEQRELEGRVQEQRRIFETFLLLVVLGGLGSLIFLMRDYMAPAVDTPMSAYIFRPILGMLLAVAVFVLTILTHSVVSSADMLQIRKEPLFVLAFAAGLLSEQTYEIILLRAQTTLSKARAEFDRNKRDEDKEKAS